MSASPLQTARVHQSVSNPFFHSNFVSRPMSGRLTLTAVTLHKKRTRLGSEKSDCSPAWSWSSFQHRAMRFLASTESPCGCRMGHTAAMAPRALCAATPSLLAQIRLETPHGGVRTPCAGELIPEISVLPSGEPRSPSHAEEDPAFLRSTDPDSLRSAGRCGIAPPPTHSLSQRPGRGPWERAAILSAHRPLWASGGARGRVFQAGGWGNPQRAPRTGLGGDASMPPASRSPRPPRRSPADSPPPSLRTAPPTTGTFSNFSLPGKRRGPASALSRGPGRGTPGGRPSGSEDPPPVPAQRSALGGAQPSVPALRERPGWRREGEARRADAEETEVPPAPSGHRPAGTGSGVLWQSVVTGTP